MHFVLRSPLSSSHRYWFKTFPGLFQMPRLALRCYGVTLLILTVMDWLLLPSSCRLLLLSFSSVRIWHSAYQKPWDPPCHGHTLQAHTRTVTHLLQLFPYHQKSFFLSFSLFCHTLVLLTDRNKTHVIWKTWPFLPGDIGNIHHLKKKKTIKYRIKSVLYRNIFLWWNICKMYESIM